MARFLSTLETESAGNGLERLTQPLVYAMGCHGHPLALKVPSGFVTDFATVPDPLLWLYPQSGRYKEAAVLHDWMYSRAEFGRLLADVIFLDAMHTLHVSLWRRLSMFWAVRMFGWLYRR